MNPRATPSRCEPFTVHQVPAGIQRLLSPIPSPPTNMNVLGRKKGALPLKGLPSCGHGDLGKGHYQIATGVFGLKQGVIGAGQQLREG